MSCRKNTPLPPSYNDMLLYFPLHVPKYPFSQTHATSLVKITSDLHVAESSEHFSGFLPSTHQHLWQVDLSFNSWNSVSPGLLGYCSLLVVLLPHRLSVLVSFGGVPLQAQYWSVLAFTLGPLLLFIYSHSLPAFIQFCGFKYPHIDDSKILYLSSSLSSELSFIFPAYWMSNKHLKLNFFFNI